MTNKQQAKTDKPKPPNAGKGRPKGTPNRVTKQLKDMILGALDQCGGQDYLAERAQDPKTASAFLTLVGKVLPMQVTGADGEDLSLKVTVKYVKPSHGG